ncbi:MAG: hypothetical protein R3A80_01970 [Bdellovibrionota bacterium]
MNFFFITASRHDSDRVELQIGFDGEVQNEKTYDFEVNIQFIFPRSLGLAENFDKDALKSQLQSHLRLHTHAGSPQSPTKLTRVRERLELLSHHLSEESLKFFALEIEAFLKFEIKAIKKSIRSKKDLPIKQALEQLSSTQEIIADYRKLLSQRHLMGKSAKDFSFESFDHDLLLLDEYLSHLYVVLLSHLKYYCETGHSDSPFMDKVPQMAKEEAEHRQRLGYFLQDEKSKNISEEEHYLRRAGLLKKYFQKILFIRGTQSTRENRLLIPVYGISAAIAASFAISVQFYQMDRQDQALGLSTIAFVGIAVIAYVVKDILKDHARKYFFHRSQKYFPDYKIKLSYAHKTERESLGNVDEFLRLSNAQDLPSEVKELRFSTQDVDLEPEVEEDVVEYKKQFHLNLRSLELREHYHWGIREVMRIQLDRYTTSMDDPTKMLHLLRPDGSIESHMGHRVYLLYMSVSIRPLDSFTSSDLGTLKLFRIKMDKTGVLSVESVKKDDSDATELPNSHNS